MSYAIYGHTNMTQHPTLETLSSYILSPQEQEFRDLRRHLVSCQQCRQRTDQLSALTRQLQQEIPLYRTDCSEIEEASYRPFPGETLTETQRNTLKQSPTALKAALHSLTHSAAMQREMQRPSTTSTTADTVVRQKTSVKSESFIHWWKHLFNWHHPAWISVPVTAVLVFALTLTLTPQLRQNSSSAYITAYQDDPVVTFQAAGSQHPGIGFFSNVPSTRKPFSPVNVAMNTHNNLELHWPAIEKAIDYTVQIARIEGTSPTQLFQQTTTGTQIQFTNFTPYSGHRYTWTLTGKTSDGQRFQAQGGFVIK